MKKLKTTDDILKDRTLFSVEQANKIEENAIAEAKAHWGGKRAGAGRKAKGEHSLNISMKVNEIELAFIKQAREIGVNLNLINLQQYLS